MIDVETLEGVYCMEFSTTNKITELIREFEMKLKKICPKQYIEIMENFVEEMKQNIQYYEYEQLKQELMKELLVYCNGDEQEAEQIADDMAYDCIYREEFVSNTQATQLEQRYFSKYKKAFTLTLLHTQDFVRN